MIMMIMCAISSHAFLHLFNFEYNKKVYFYQSSCFFTIQLIDYRSLARLDHCLKRACLFCFNRANYLLSKFKSSLFIVTCANLPCSLSHSLTLSLSLSFSLHLPFYHSSFFFKIVSISAHLLKQLRRRKRRNRRRSGRIKRRRRRRRKRKVITRFQIN